MIERSAFVGKSVQVSKSATNGWYSVIAIPTPAARPPLTVLPKKAPPWLLKQLGVPIRMQDPAFDGAFGVWGPSIPFAFDVLDARTRQWMLADPRFHAWPLQFQDANLLTWADSYPEPEQIAPKLDLLHEFLDRTDPRIWQQG
ncbi:hypothetical protein [Segniliparus rugosus]|uniref:Uncharacterized protein n=1 Tax=Segniliparus rugosus (strain ATCC BAA-974 / DSM 45345 / CCUG 50838 / CIP 108380 / JCM 13579 / CDC 945) TaxID=679197 RepID=E5XVD9_SEGRC|nr:hypothetical protein [Segniliparus rugosus]EFV11679.1 hypothetical protein HMPREF9336_03461 [Segniliparus rugosus ATCC BAA-974]